MSKDYPSQPQEVGFGNLKTSALKEYADRFQKMLQAHLKGEKMDPAEIETIALYLERWVQELNATATALKKANAK